MRLVISSKSRNSTTEIFCWKFRFRYQNVSLTGQNFEPHNRRRNCQQTVENLPFFSSPVTFMFLSDTDRTSSFANNCLSLFCFGLSFWYVGVVQRVDPSHQIPAHLPIVAVQRSDDEYVTVIMPWTFVDDCLMVTFEWTLLHLAERKRDSFLYFFLPAMNRKCVQSG